MLSLGLFSVGVFLLCVMVCADKTCLENERVFVFAFHYTTRSHREMDGCIYVLHSQIPYISYAYDS